ncbi:MAG: SUMF1/EgtB/PvdO family nonheme iron enzyme [Verrucomicrobia bacterium]|nr:SUMF1/EgtB/PvdO family nonheme iron enzyme [Verrucomicrobiota bacterium]MCH8512836.1 SUMF1/EgtB/PvdO family nonheme iron enzyme [Kiritimatiellia bacterium]
MKTTLMKSILFSGLFGLGMLSATAQDSFGSGANAFSIDFVGIGNPGNLAQSSDNRSHGESGGDGYGSVGYEYRISTYAISTAMMEKADAEAGLGFTQTTRTADQPATVVNWNQAARFVNFLNEQAGYSHAYKFEHQPGDDGYGSSQNIQLWDINDPGYDANNLFRNANAYYFLPSEDEWYKAAYYDPSTGNYSLYATGSDTAPTAVSGGTDPDTAVFGQSNQQGPADVDNAGGLSFYGTMAQGGNTWEWLESAFDGVNNVGNEARSYRGGPWNAGESELRSSIRYSQSVGLGTGTTGFRVASIPEPSTMVMLFVFLGASALVLRGRKG